MYISIHLYIWNYIIWVQELPFIELREDQRQQENLSKNFYLCLNRSSPTQWGKEGGVLAK